MNTAPILVVDDDLDEQDFITQAWEELPFENESVFFTNAEDVIKYLKEEEVTPFLIISDVNLNRTTGFELKDRLLHDKSLNHKTIPFVFFSNSATDKQISKSYDLGSNGFFIKGNNIAEIRNTLKDIVTYWQNSKTPEG